VLYNVSMDEEQEYLSSQNRLAHYHLAFKTVIIVYACMILVALAGIGVMTLGLPNGVVPAWIWLITVCLVATSPIPMGLTIAIFLSIMKEIRSEIILYEVHHELR